MLSKLFAKKRTRLPRTLSYEEAKRFARQADATARADLASRGDVAPEILYYLAEDKEASVRIAVADNEAAPGPADLLLARDDSDDVRSSLAGKLARLAPGLDPHEQDKLRRATYDALAMLAKDQAVRIRQVLSDALKEAADAPPDVIRRLAFDVEASVSSPVLRYSPVLSDQDLIEIIEAKPNAESVSAIARRANVSEVVSDAVVDSNDVEAVKFLLGNHSAQIREETLDRVIDRAVDIDLWHAPLAMRPKLPTGAAAKIARFVADDILKRMAARHDLPEDSIAAVKSLVAKRLETDAVAKSDDEPVAEQKMVTRKVSVDEDDVFDRATKMWADGKLNEKAVQKALKESDTKLAMAMIAVMADVPFRAVVKTCNMNSAKGCVALTWKAGLSASLGDDVQKQLGQVPPDELLKSRGKNYPLDENELEWQIEFIRDF